ncbi:MAG: hypothetical protein JWQ27_1781 [Ferruginibacter sp.]|nr:hypothetical protein [Ferruginibacter sp.]
MHNNTLAFCLSLLISGAFSLTAASQDPEKKFRVNYSFISYPSAIAEEDSIKFILIDKNGDTTVSKIRNSGLSKYNTSTIQFDYRVTGSKTTAEIQLDRSSGGKIPDKVFYKKGEWYSTSENGIKQIPLQHLQLTYLKTVKMILGHSCERAVGTIIETNQAVELFVCKGLPATIMPGGGFQPLTGAILEMNIPESNMSFHATKIAEVQ